MEKKHHQIILAILGFFALAYTAYIFQKQAAQKPLEVPPAPAVEDVKPAPVEAPAAPAK